MVGENEQSQSSPAKPRNSQEAIKNLAPEFHALSSDIQEVMEFAKDPAFVAALMFKLVKEREQTNKLLEQINEKYDTVMFELKTRSPQPLDNTPLNPQSNFQVLPEQDQKIMMLADEKGTITAHTIQQSLGYKGLNAACQRLNKLYREGHLKKIQSGKQVLFIPAR